MLSIVRNLKDGEYLISEDEAIKLGSTLIAEYDDASDAVKAKEMHRAIESNNIKAAAYSITGKKATPQYKSLDLGVDGNVIVGGKK